MDNTNAQPRPADGSTTERETIADLRRQEQLLHVIIESLPVGLWITDESGRIVSGNQAGRRVWAGARFVGVEEYGEYQGWWAETGKPIAADEWALARAIRRGETSINELIRIRCFDGSYKTILNSATPLMDGDRILGAIVVNQDVSRLVEAEAGLRVLAQAGRILSQSLDYHVTLREVARMAVPTVADGCVVYLVAEDGDVVPAAIHCVDPEQQWATEESLRRYPVRGAARGAGKVIVTGEPDLVERLRPEFWAEVGLNPEHEALLRRTGLSSYVTVPLPQQGHVIGAITFFDTDKGRQIDQHHVPLAEELGRRAGQAIENARLYEAAQRASRARDEILSVVAHDLRGPLSTIDFVARTLQHKPRNTEQVQRAAETVLRATRRMNRLIEDLLDVTRIESGHGSIVRSPTDPSAVVEEAIELARPAAGGLDLHAELESGLPLIDADRGRILQVLANLIGNAIKFTPAGGAIAVGAAPSGDAVRFWVRDTGRGMDAAQLARAFDRFYQSDARDRRGVGLGLAIAQGIVAAHGGRIWADSRPDAGTTFWFTVPRAAS
jgi:signal transduction histidine kinase